MNGNGEAAREEVTQGGDAPAVAARRRAMDAQLPYAALTAEEQLERVHHVVAMLDQRVAMLQQLLDALTRHAHAPDGTLMTPLKLAMGAIHGRALGDNPQAWF